MSRFVAFLTFVALGACSVESDPDGTGPGPGAPDDPLKPQPEPEHFRALSIRPEAIRFARSAGTLILTGAPGALAPEDAQAGDARVVLTELRDAAPVLEVEVAVDGSFRAELESTGATSVQLAPATADALGEGLLLDVAEDGSATQPAPSCLVGTRGVWQLGDVATGSASLSGQMSLLNSCGRDVVLERFTMRRGDEFSIDPLALPLTLPANASQAVTVRFELAAGEPRQGTARSDVVDVQVRGVRREGFVVRVTRGAATPTP